MRLAKPIMGTGAIALIAVLGVGRAGASGDSSCDPDWTLASYAMACGNSALLSPGNDTRVNLFLLHQARPTGKPVSYAKPPWGEESFGHSYFGWGTLRDTYAGRTGTEDQSYSDAASGTRCASLGPGADAFAAALTASKGVSAADRDVLAKARAGLASTCESGSAVPAPPAGMSSAAGREFAGYIGAAGAFYAGQWDAARQGFTALAKASDPWVAETAAYMLIRVDVNAAQANSFDEYGDFTGPEKVDQAAIQRTRAAIATYLKRYPTGRYATSAQGLQRRALWLGGDMAGLGREYERLLGTLPPGTDQAALLMQEIDNKLLFAKDADKAIETPLLLATLDLLRMRADDPDQSPALTTAALAAQRPRFAGRADLFAYLQAAHAFYVEKDAARALTLLPADAAGDAGAPLGFSARMLRGMALSAGKDGGETAYWQALIPVAKDPYQRPLAELALALAWQRSGAIAQVFSPGSPVRDARIREILLMRLAGPDLLRAAARGADAPNHSRDVATFTLLAKNLSRQRYADFGKDIPLVPANADTEGSLWGFQNGEKIPVGLFTRGKWSDGYPCPAIAGTAATLARDPANVAARLCLGDFWRLNGFDQFDMLEPVKADGSLGSGPGQFPGKALTRGDIYASVIADPGATANDKAYALYRAVYCYAPSGGNDCGGVDAEPAQRRAWFQRLKRDYPQSRWARDLRFYW